MLQTRTDFPLEGNEAQLARGAALRLLTARSRTVSDMRERLGRRFSREAVEQTLARLLEEGLLDDAEFAQQWRQSRERRKPRSRSMIELELKQKGIAEDVIVDTLEDYDSLDAAYRSATRYAARLATADRPTFDRRVGAYLNRRGFDPSVTKQTLQRLRDELNIGYDKATDASTD